MSWEGFRRYVAGEGKAYHYLTEVVRVSTVGGDFHSSNEDPFWTEADVLSRIPIITIQLPNDFKGKHFELFLNARLSSHNVEVALKHHRGLM